MKEKENNRRNGPGVASVNVKIMETDLGREAQAHLRPKLVASLNVKNKLPHRDRPGLTRKDGPRFESFPLAP